MGRVVLWQDRCCSHVDQLVVNYLPADPGGKHFNILERGFRRRLVREPTPEEVERVDLAHAELKEHVAWQDEQLLLSVTFALHCLELRAHCASRLENERPGLLYPVQLLEHAVVKRVRLHPLPELSGGPECKLALVPRPI